MHTFGTCRLVWELLGFTLRAPLWHLRGLRWPKGTCCWLALLVVASVLNSTAPCIGCSVIMCRVASIELTGMAWVTFNSPVEAAAASSKHRQNMGPRYIEVMPAAADGAWCLQVVTAQHGLLHDSHANAPWTGVTLPEGPSVESSVERGDPDSLGVCKSCV